MICIKRLTEALIQPHSKNMIAATYSADCFASGLSVQEIGQEINRVNKYWEKGDTHFQFPGSAHYQYCRMERLKQILAERQKTS